MLSRICNFDEKHLKIVVSALDLEGLIIAITK